MHRLSFAAVVLALAACDASFEKAVDLLSGRETNVVVLVAEPAEIGATPTVLASSKEPMKVLGEWSSLCFALRGDTALQDTKTMDDLFAEAMGSSKVKIELTMASGARVTLRRPLQAWSLRGRIVQHNELSACASAPCKSELPVGTQVQTIEVTADPPLAVKGVYWHSETDLPKPASAEKPVASASSPQGRSACSA